MAILSGECLYRSSRVRASRDRDCYGAVSVHSLERQSLVQSLERVPDLAMG